MSCYATLKKYWPACSLKSWKRGRPGVEDLLATHSASGVSFFKLQSRQAKDALAALSSGVTLGEVRDVLRMYSQALMGRSVSVLSTADLQEGSPKLAWE